MRKTSLYLSERAQRRLAQLAEQENRSQAEIVRDAIAAYVPRSSADRDFQLFASGEGDGTSVADLDDAELLDGFGE